MSSLARLRSRRPPNDLDHGASEHSLPGPRLSAIYFWEMIQSIEPTVLLPLMAK